MWQQSMCLHFLLDPPVCSHVQELLVHIWCGKSDTGGLSSQKSLQLKKKGGNFCSWPRRSVKDQINPPTLTKIRQNTQQNSGHQAVRTVTSERWETWGKPYDCPAYCRERESRLQQRDRKPHQSPEDSMLRRQNERLHRPRQLGVQDRDQRGLCAGHEQALGLWGAPGVFSRALLDASSWRNYQGENSKRMGKRRPELTRRGNSACNQ